MLHETDLKQLYHPCPVVIGPSQEGLCPATHYPNHYEESGAFINKHIPLMFESAAKAVIGVIEVVSLGKHPCPYEITETWRKHIASSNHPRH